MAECDEFFHIINKKAVAIYAEIPEECERTLEWLRNYQEIKMKEFRNEICNGTILSKTPGRHTKRIRSPALSTSSNEENTSSQVNHSTDVTDSTLNSTKPKRNACRKAEEKINLQSKIKLNTKMRRPGKDSVLNDISNNSAVLTIKCEKISSSPRKDTVAQIKVKKEKEPEPENIKKESMPPPAAKPKRGRKKRIKKEDVESSDTENEGVRVTRSKQSVKSSAAEKPKRPGRPRRDNRPDSDVILQEVPVPLVVIDSEEDIHNQNKTETMTEKPKETETPAETDEESAPERTGKRKIKKKTDKKTTKAIENKDESVYEDALPIISNPQNKDEDILKMMNCVVNLENISTNGSQKDLNETHVKSPALNQTHILTKQIDLLTQTPNATVVLQRLDQTVTLPTRNLNQTVVLSPKEKNHEWIKPDVPIITDNLLTDDDSIVVKETPEKKIQPPRKKVKTESKTKQIFSPYANSPVRNRVAAFEKLVQNDPEQPTRVTRTKTRNMEKNKENHTSTESVKAPTKSKYFTPTANNKLPSMIPQSDSKIRPGTSTILPMKSSSAVKPSRAELQIRREEEQKKRLEKEEEAKRKREAIMLAKAEEQRKKREEKQLKAQKAREEMEREKEEKLRQMLQEKEEEQQKKREWQAKKIAVIEEKKRLEEQHKMYKLKEQEKQKQLEETQKKKKQKPQLPPLPTGDWEDSGSDSDQPVFRKPPYIKPDWAHTKSLYATMAYQSAVSQVHIKEWFHMEATTPDLQEIFENIDERYLRRNSSAVWRTPPRYSTLPKY